MSYRIKYIFYYISAPVYNGFIPTSHCALALTRQHSITNSVFQFN